MSWITEIADRIARESGLDAGSLAVDDREAELLLDLAGVAAHSTGARTNAPLLCHVLGRAVAQGASLDELADVVRDHRA